MTHENTLSKFDEIDLLCSLRVGCIVQCEDGRHVVYHDEKKNRFILAGFWVFVFGEEDDPPEMFKPNRIYGEGKDLDSISIDFRRVYGKSIWGDCRIVFLNVQGRFAPLLFEEWKRLRLRQPPGFKYEDFFDRMKLDYQRFLEEES